MQSIGLEIRGSIEQLGHTFKKEKMIQYNKIMTKSVVTLLLVSILANGYLMQVAQAAAGAAAATTANQATTTTSTTTSDASNAAASGAGGAAAAAGGAQNYPQNGPFSQVQGLVGGALSIASMPLNTITTSLNQLGLQNLATAPLNAVSTLIHQAGGLYGR